MMLVLTTIYAIYSAIVSIYKFYIPQQLPKILKIGSITATSLLTSCQIFNLITWISKYRCYKFGYYAIGSMLVVSYSVGYMLLFLMFSLKVQSSTKDTIYRLSNILIGCLIMLIILFIVLVVFVVIYLYTNQHRLNNIFTALAFINNLILYILLLYKLLSTLFYVFKTNILLSPSNFNYNQKSKDEWISVFDQIFNYEIKNNIIDSNARKVEDLTENQNSTDMNVDSDVKSSDRKYNDNNSMLDRSTIKAFGIARIMIRITVCVSVVFVSNIVVLIVLASLSMLSLHQNGILLTLLHLCYSIDLMLNNFCLLYQYQFAQKSYDKNCKFCDKFLKNTIFCGIETNMKSVSTTPERMSTTNLNV